MTKQTGNLIYLSWGATDVVGLTTKSINITRDMLDFTDQQSTGGWKEYKGGEKTGTIDVQGLYDENSAQGALSAFDALDDGSEITFKFGEKTTGTKYLTGTALVSNLTIDGPKNDPSSYSFTLQISGPVSKATN
jgi:TP901-1 family phage major tail protein